MWEGVWDRVEAFTNTGPDSRCQLCCGLGHIKNKCGNKPKCGYCSGNNQMRDHRCNVVGCTAKKGSLRSHTLEKCPNCEGNQIVFGSTCAKMSTATKAVRQSREMPTAGLATKSASVHMATGTYNVVRGPTPRAGVAAGWGRE